MMRSRALALVFVGLLASTAASGTPILTGTLVTQTGPQNDTIWAFTISNPQAAPVTNVEFTGLFLAQTSGPACTPVVLTTLPVGVGTIAGNGTSALFGIGIDFTGCFDGDPLHIPPIPGNTFDMVATFSGDDGALGNLFIAGVTRLTQPSISVPEPATLALLAAALIGLGLARRRPC